MRAIALAILISGAVIEQAIRPIERTHRHQQGDGIVVLVFFVCLVFGW